MSARVRPDVAGRRRLRRARVRSRARPTKGLAARNPGAEAAPARHEARRRQNGRIKRSSRHARCSRTTLASRHTAIANTEPSTPRAPPDSSSGPISSDRRALSTPTPETLGPKTNTVGGGITHVRRITKNGASKLAAIRTSQDTWIAFMRNKDNTKWTTLADVDVVVVASVGRHPDPEDSSQERCPWRL